MYGIYNIGVSYDGALKSKGPEYAQTLLKVDTVDCKYEHKQANVEHEQLSGTQIRDLIEKVALPNCGVKQIYQLQDTVLEAIKFVHLKGKSGVVMTAVDALKKEKGDKCEKSVDLVKLICPRTLKKAGYKD